MDKYIITKKGKEYRCLDIYSHRELIEDNHLRLDDIIEEGIIDNNKRYIISERFFNLNEQEKINYQKLLNKRNKDEWTKGLLKARELESLYSYGIIKEGD